MSEGNGVAEARLGNAAALPEGWRWVILADVLREAQPGFASGNRDPRGIVQLRMNNVTTQGTFDWTTLTRVPVDPSIRDKFTLQPGDVLFNNTNSAELVGKSAIFLSHDEPIVYSNHFTRLRVRADVGDPAFLALFLQHQWKQRVFESICNRWVGQAAVHRDKLLALPIPLPPLAEQRRIAARLGEAMAAVERARTAAMTQLEASRHLSTALLNATFDSSDAREWPTVPLKVVGDIRSGITLGRKLRVATSTTRPYLRVTNVKDGFLDLANVKQIDVTIEEATKYELRWGDLLLTEGGDPDKLGRGTFWQEEIPGCLHQNHIFRVRFDLDQHDPAFLSAQIGSGYDKRYFLAHAKQTTGIATINQRVLGEFPLRVPSLCVQRNVAERLSVERGAAKAATESVEWQLALIDQLWTAALESEVAPPSRS